MHFVEGLSIKAIARRTGRDRNTVRSPRASQPALSPRHPRRSSRAPARGAQAHAPAAAPMPQTALRSVLRVPQQPYFRFDTNDHSLDVEPEDVVHPGLLGG
jgi:hypothetical protein